jgi:two-component system, NarL family, invasion response regulator UvrY
MAIERAVAQTETNPVNLLLVDHRQLVREGLARLLRDVAMVSGVAVAGDWEGALQALRTRPVDVAIVSRQDSTADLLGGVRKFARYSGRTRLLVMTPPDDLIVQDRLLQTGVAGCVDARCSLQELLAAVGVVCRGGRYISDQLARELAFNHLPGSQGVPLNDLTHRELQILLLVAEGKNAAGISRALGLTAKTVNVYRNRLLEKLSVDTDVQLAHLAIRHGLVDVAQPA